MERATIYSIAKALGIHASTVSRALNHPDMVRQELREMVVTKAAELGYVQNFVARGLITGRSGLIGLFVPDIENPFFPPLVRAIEDASRAAELKVLLMDSRMDPRAESELLEQVLAYVDGVVFAAPRAQPHELVRVSRGLPVVFINRTLEGARSVSVDNDAALTAAGENLLQHGHHHLVLLRGPKDSWAADRRARVVKHWAERAQVDLLEVGPVEATYEGGVAKAPLIAASRATAVVAFDDVMACGVIAGLLDLGLSVPKEVSVVGCDDVLLARTMYPPLTTIRAPFEEIGRRAVEMLIEEIQGLHEMSTEQLPCELQLPGDLVSRSSTGPAPAIDTIGSHSA